VSTPGWYPDPTDANSIRYYDGSIIVRAPDYIQRQIGGYGAIPMPPARHFHPTTC